LDGQVLGALHSLDIVYQQMTVVLNLMQVHGLMAMSGCGNETPKAGAPRHGGKH
jgi:hypothetical protein